MDYRHPGTGIHANIFPGKKIMCVDSIDIREHEIIKHHNSDPESVSGREQFNSRSVIETTLISI